MIAREIEPFAEWRFFEKNAGQFTIYTVDNGGNLEKKCASDASRERTVREKKAGSDANQNREDRNGIGRNRSVDEKPGEWPATGRWLHH